jgi:hypothetical protein
MKEKYDTKSRMGPSLKRETHTQFPSQISKSGWINKGFGEGINKLSVCVNMGKIYVPFLIMIFYKMKVDIDVFGL